MLPPHPDSRPVALTIAGSDSGGGAGIQADLAAIAGQGAYGTSVVTAITAQHTRGVEGSFPLPAEEVAAQLSAVRDDFAITGAKTGMLATAEIVESVAERAGEFGFPLVVDPVMVASSGDRLLEPAAERAYEELIAEAALVTPNADEAEVLTGRTITSPADARAAGEDLRDLGAEAALVTGGHLPGERISDVLVDGEGARTMEHPRIDTDATHGSGCALSAAIAARLAAGDDLRAAVEAAVAALSRAVRFHYDVGGGPGAVNHALELRNAAARADVAEAVGALAEPDGERVAVAGATPYAANVDDVAVADGARPRFGLETDAANALLAAREERPDLRFVAIVGGRRAAPARPVVESDTDPSEGPFDLPGDRSPVAVAGAERTVLFAADAGELRRAVADPSER
ncbi:bifunctional hydroxymethylpyrimidine kinase/phosphomethylpyrimidine kinase [Saliphagus infecundisoli]|uniref:Bifunctional hydroxymethylpyrimidine kinase/phosphomethylpyrimidine kinase n=1 Tax=Saliphagus infecundisoli TaxID=1849069 RepID=A0ABD5QDP5_9EURY|nr:bifunctional hydroxymethylpyrimidine kinase/phosphomethylpyrimidine kinase [Saliphagus infecundisoli]